MNTEHFMMGQILSAGGNCLLAVAHPGHELRIHGWLERAKPAVIVITDGSGHRGNSRLPWTQRILQDAGARTSPILGRHTDAELYAALMRSDHAPFRDLMQDLVFYLRENQIQAVVADAADSYNPMHDICRLIVNCAVSQLNNEGRKLLNYSFPLVGPPALRSAGKDDFVVRLDDDAFLRKSAAVKGYTILRDEIAGAIGSCPWEEFRHEYLYLESGITIRPAGKPYYEIYGEAQVAAGLYQSILRFEPHMRQLVEVLELESVQCAS